MSAARKVSLAASLALLAACGGGGGGPPPPPPGFTVGGAIAGAGAQAVDGDTNDALQARTPNDVTASAQALPSAVTVGGWANAALDPVDWYRARLAQGQVVTLGIADHDAANAAAVDLDMCLFEASNPTVPIDCAVDTTAVEQLTVPAAGDYLVGVEAVASACRPPPGRPTAPPVECSNYTLTLGAPAAAAPTLRTGLPFVPGQVVVRFRDSALAALRVGEDTLGARAAALGLEPGVGSPRGMPVMLELGPGEPGRARAFAALGIPERPGRAAEAAVDPDLAARRDTLAVVKALRARADVESADPNFVFTPARVPNDTHYARQWHYPLINLPQAWDVTTGTPATGDVIVAVIDTGLFLAHPDFPASKRAGGHDFISSTTRSNDGDGIDPNPDDPGDEATAGASSWHGTHVAGTVGAATDDGAGAAGVSWGARIMSLRALGVGGGSSIDIMNAVRYAAGLANVSGTVPPRRADVMNLSLGCLGCSSATEQAVFAEARAAGVIVVAAAGNENTTQRSYPASYDGVLSVSAVDLAGARAPYTNTGDRIDLAAPGGNAAVDRNGDGYVDGVLSAIADDATGTRRPAWAFYQGTSMAAPHVAGVIALMKAVCPTLGPVQLDAILAAGGMTRGSNPPVRTDVVGQGIVDALEAVQAAQTQCGLTPAATLDVSPGRLDFGASQASLGLSVNQVGGPPGELTVTASDDAPWLTLDRAGGLGAYTATVDRGALADGTYSATLTFTATGGAAPTVRVPVTVQKGAAAAGGSVGVLYALLVNPATGSSVKQVNLRGSGGSYPFTFTGVAAGEYLVVAGTDLDDDGFICDAGEACGAWPTLGVPTPLTVGASASGIDFVAGYEVGLAPAAAGVAGSPEGFRRLPEEKRIGGAR
jgi:serine protease